MKRIGDMGLGKCRVVERVVKGEILKMREEAIAYGLSLFLITTETQRLPLISSPSTTDP